ncbi:MFS transporter [Paenibacillus aurantius]|uniref:MFS transporter n=1 Tax=Paenibacillus aurantius TaxID=2918900 RepID=A0AA96RDW4_9BACL|nr:MFS transporter [Paenibacillus aurantius]WNQ09866.1 MFS transporter [Paenibacillus aurantius]
MKQDTLWTRSFLTISFSSFFIFMTFYILAVTLPTFVLEELQGSKDQIGLVMTVFIVAAVIFRVVTGKWLDEKNRKVLVTASLVMFMVCSFLYLFIHQFYLLLALRFVHGIAFGISATATSAIVLDVIPEKRKGEGIGYFSLFMSLAMVVGPFLGLTLTTHTSYTVLFIVVSVLALLALLCGAVTAISSPPKKPSPFHSWSIKRYLEPKAMPISMAGFVLAFSYGAISTFISVYAKSIGLETIASYFFIVFAAMILISRPFTGRLFDRKGEHVLVYPGIVLFVIGMVWLSQAYSAPIFLLTGGIIGLGYGAILPSFQTIAVQSAPPHRRGLATGTYFVFFDSGYGLGSYFLGLLAARTDYHTMYLWGGLLVFLSLILYYALHHRKQRSEARKMVME